MERNHVSSRLVLAYAPSLGGHSSSYVCEIPPITFSLTQRVLAALKSQIFAMLATYSVENGKLSIFASTPVLFLVYEYPDGDG